MITSRLSGAQQRNAAIELMTHDGANSAWLSSLSADFVQPGAVVLLGGASAIDFRIRVAQSHLRHDLLPSFWSQVGILVSRNRLLTVPLDERLAPGRVPATNAIHEVPLAAYDDPAQYPNIGVLNFAERGNPMIDHARRLAIQRSAIDLPQLVIAWLGFVWGAGTSGNPLFQSYGLPSAALVETAYGIGGIELTPGIASAASCPEAIWQAAVWWHEYYEKTATARIDQDQEDAKSRVESGRPATIVPSGAYVTRQPAAAVTVETATTGSATPSTDSRHQSPDRTRQQGGGSSGARARRKR